MSSFSGIYLESWFSWFREGMQKALKKRKQTEETLSKIKRKKHEEYRESQRTTIHIFGFTFHLKNHIFLENITLHLIRPLHFIYSFYALQVI